MAGVATVAKGRRRGDLFLGRIAKLDEQRDEQGDVLSTRMRGMAE
jgi:hypothetical protein